MSVPLQKINKQILPKTYLVPSAVACAVKPSKSFLLSLLLCVLRRLFELKSTLFLNMAREEEKDRLS